MQYVAKMLSKLSSSQGIVFALFRCARVDILMHVLISICFAHSIVSLNMVFTEWLKKAMVFTQYIYVH